MFKNFCLIFISSLIFTTHLHGNKWELTNNEFTFRVNSKDYNLALNKMISLDGTIFAINTNSRHGVVKLKNEIDDWEVCFLTQPPDLNITPIVYDIDLIDDKIFAPSDLGLIYHSFDKGESWDSTFLGEEYKHPIKHLKFVNESVGFVGHILENAFLKTTDGGKTWNPLPSTKGQLPDLFVLLNFIPIDENIIYLVGEWTDGYHFYYTDNGGETWNKLNTIPFESYPQVPARYFHLHYINSQFIVEKRFKPSSIGNTNIMKSKDFVNWEPLFISDTISGGKFIQDIQFFDNLIVGLGIQIFVISTDGGTTWVDLYDESDEFYRNELNGFANIDGIIYAQGSILQKGDDGGNISIPKLYKYKLDLKSSVVSQKFSFNVYPNPAKNEINIKADKTINTVEIIDLNGKSVLNNKNLTPKMEQNIKIDYLKTGTYFIRINENVYKRFIKE